MGVENFHHFGYIFSCREAGAVYDSGCKDITLTYCAMN